MHSLYEIRVTKSSEISCLDCRKAGAITAIRPKSLPILAWRQFAEAQAKTATEQLKAVTEQLTAAQVLPALEAVFRPSCAADDETLTSSMPMM